MLLEIESVFSGSLSPLHPLPDREPGTLSSPKSRPQLGQSLRLEFASCFDSTQSIFVAILEVHVEEIGELEGKN